MVPHLGSAVRADRSTMLPTGPRCIDVQQFAQPNVDPPLLSGDGSSNVGDSPGVVQLRFGRGLAADVLSVAEGEGGSAVIGGFVQQSSWFWF